MNIKLPLILAGLVLASLALTGCTNATPQTPTPVQPVAEQPTTAQKQPLTGEEIMFAQMMIPHHQQAIALAEIAETRTTNPDILTLAKNIKNAQDPEIAQMTELLTQAGAPTTMGHDMLMPGLLTTTQLEELKTKTGTDFDKTWLTYMTAHHQGAIEMVSNVMSFSNQNMTTIAQNITTAQQQEIATMQNLQSQNKRHHRQQ